jgi:hypothetical protein
VLPPTQRQARVSGSDSATTSPRAPAWSHGNQTDRSRPVTPWPTHSPEQWPQPLPPCAMIAALCSTSRCTTSRPGPPANRPNPRTCSELVTGGGPKTAKAATRSRRRHRALPPAPPDITRTPSGRSSVRDCACDRRRPRSPHSANTRLTWRKAVDEEGESISLIPLAQPPRRRRDGQRCRQWELRIRLAWRMRGASIIWPSMVRTPVAAAESRTRLGVVSARCPVTGGAHRVGRADLLDGRLDLVWLARCDHRTRAALGQLLGNGEADPAGRAGDQRGFAREVLGWT